MHLLYNQTALLWIAALSVTNYYKRDYHNKPESEEHFKLKCVTHTRLPGIHARYVIMWTKGVNKIDWPLSLLSIIDLLDLLCC